MAQHRPTSEQNRQASGVWRDRARGGPAGGGPAATLVGAAVERDATGPGPYLSLRELRKALEGAPDVSTARAMLRATYDLGGSDCGGGDGGSSGGEAHTIGPRAVCALITQLGRAKQCDKAIAVFDECTALGVEPNAHIFSALVSACSAGSRWEESLAYFARAKSLGAANEITFSAGIAACVRAGHLDRGLELLGEMQEGGMAPDAMTFAAILGAAERAGRWRDHDSLISDMHARGLVAPCKIYAGALVRCRQTADWEGALRTYEGMQAAAAAAAAAADRGDSGAAPGAQSSPAPARRAPAVGSSLAAPDDPSLLLQLLRTLLEAQRRERALDALRDWGAVLDGAACGRVAELLAKAGLDHDAARLRHRMAQLHGARRGRGGRGSGGGDAPARGQLRPRPPTGAHQGSRPVPVPGRALAPQSLGGGLRVGSAAAETPLQNCSPADSPHHSDSLARSDSGASTSAAGRHGHAAAAGAMTPEGGAQHAEQSPPARRSASMQPRGPHLQQPPPPLLPPAHGDRPPVQVSGVGGAPPPPPPMVARHSWGLRPQQQRSECAHFLPPKFAQNPAWPGQGQWPVPPYQAQGTQFGPYVHWARPMPLACVGAWVPQQYIAGPWVWPPYAPYLPAGPPPPPGPPPA